MQVQGCVPLGNVASRAYGTGGDMESLMQHSFHKESSCFVGLTYYDTTYKKDRSHGAIKSRRLL